MSKKPVTRVSNLSITPISNNQNSQGGFDLKHIRVAANYQILPSDIIIGVNSNVAAITVTLPVVTNTREGQIFIVQDEGNNANTNNITIARNGANIDGAAANATITGNSGTIRLYSTGTEWFIW